MRTANANVDALFIAGSGTIVCDVSKGRRLYGEAMRM
jgi:hypothetical protein